MSGWLVRAELPDDEAAIAELIEAAFCNALHTDGSESAIPARLRDSGELALSLVAESNGRLVGHAALSPVTISDGSRDWYGLGPISVIPLRQREGIGTALIRDALGRLRSIGANGCVVLGEPAYYARFGFTPDPELTYPGPPPEYFQCLVLNGQPARGAVRYAAAFG